MATNPYDLALWIGLDVSQVFGKDSNGAFNYSATAQKVEPASSTNNYVLHQYTATISNGLIVITVTDESSAPPGGTWIGARSYSMKITNTITYNIYTGAYLYSVSGGQNVIDNSGESHSSVATGGTAVVVPVVAR